MFGVRFYGFQTNILKLLKVEPIKLKERNMRHKTRRYFDSFYSEFKRKKKIRDLKRKRIQEKT